MSIYSNDNIIKIVKLTTRELPQKSKNAKITVRENNGLYSTRDTRIFHSNNYDYGGVKRTLIQFVIFRNMLSIS